MLWNKQEETDNYKISYSVMVFPAGLSHRLKPARCAAQAVEKVTAGPVILSETGTLEGIVYYSCLEERKVKLCINSLP